MSDKENTNAKAVVETAQGPEVQGERDLATTNPVAAFEPKGDDNVVVAQKYSKSVLTDSKQYYRALLTAAFLVFCGAAAYVVMVFIALPLAVHSIVNDKDGCDLAEDDSCFAPTDESQRIFTLALTLLRVMTFIFGSILGTISDKYGRRPVMIFALTGYVTASLLFIIGWNARDTTYILIGTSILGSASPITPHGIAYTTDVSKPEDLAKGLGILQGFGYFCGLMFGALVSLGIASITTGQEETLENYERLFNWSFIAGLILSGSAALLGLFFLPESLHKDDRKHEISLTKANPIGFLTLVTRRGYFFMVWLAGMWAWGSVGAQESALGGWWLRRYAISDTQVFIVYTLSVWVASALGAVFLTRVYLTFLGLKMSVHVGAIWTIALGFGIAFAPNSNVSYIAIPISFFAAPVFPALLAVIMGQVDSQENGALAGAIRSSEALAKLIGIATIGNGFARYIKAERPDDSCMETFDPSTGANDCLCGVDTCPYFIGPTPSDFEFRPAECDLGEMTFVTLDSASKDNPPLSDTDPYRIIPQYYFDLLQDGGIFERPDDCIGRGLLETNDGLVSTQERFWCAGVLGDAGSATPLNPFIGCPGYDYSLFTAALAFQACSDADEATLNATRVDLTDLDMGDANKDCTGFNAAVFSTLDETSFVPYVEYETAEDYEIFGRIHGRVLNLDADEVDGEYCNEEFDTMELNVCLVGPLTDTPWLYPFLFIVVFAVGSYASFVIAELFFIKGDLKQWSSESFQEELLKDEMENPTV
eukprot:augustus_masked-scaffold_35-processed-gene-1.13-mRNA-1 protein AED:0.03 eAED:0.03 QI:0/-1/0/1/-1/1/1/0/763